ncbi:MAG: hypothetical protein JSW03_08170 [Candidatus Eiseniibacteriota bacterium]|nr:MAG: hypothetical protein JSW03_08170 [Candidatus Eisenbacteria bacterium]
MRVSSFSLSPRLAAAFLCLAGSLLSGQGISVARETRFWTSETATDFRKGTPQCVSVSAQGTVSLAAQLDTLLSVEESYFWCLAEDRKGNLFAGSGDGGRVYRVSPRGEVSLFFESQDLEVLSLAVDERGSVFAGTSPAGLVYKLTPDGESSVFFETGESYVWCLTFDDAGSLYAGTGENGRIFRIESDGKGAVFYETGERHVMCAQYASGRLVAGTEGSGLVLSISGPKSAEVLYDCNEEEVRDLAVDPDGVVYAAAASSSGDEVGRPSEPEGHGPGGPGEQKRVSSSVYRIQADGTTLRLWNTSRSRIYSLWLAGKDRVVIGTREEGTVFGLSEGKLELLHKVEEAQVLDIVGGEGAFLFSTGNRARVYAAGPSLCGEGTLISETFDAVGVCRWGNLDCEALTPSGTSVSFCLRTGNSEKPDRTWSAWSEEIHTPGQFPDARPGRFAQWKAVLRSARGQSSPVLKSVVLSYLEKNLPPSVGFVRVIPQGVPFAAGGIDKITERVSQTLPEGIRVEYSLVTDQDEYLVEQAAWARTLRTAVWDASDPNGDRQIFSIYYRGTEEKEWKLLQADFSELIFTWNTVSFPDGAYVLRVVASDSPDNIPSEALTGESISLPFEVDNTPPVVSGLKWTLEQGRVRVTGRLSDNMSPVVGLHYALDGSGWKSIQASDGMLDSEAEEFSFVLEELSPGEHSVVVRVRDRAGNIGTRRVNVE